MSDSAFTWPGQRLGDRGHQMILQFLVMDIQHSPDWAAELLQQIEVVGSGQVATWQRQGNAFYLVLTPSTATLEDMVDPNPQSVEIPLEELKVAVAAWCQSIA